MTAVESDRQMVRRKSRPVKTPDHHQDVLVALRRIIRATDLHSRHVSREFGLTTPQAYVLQAIRDLGEVTTGQVSERVNLSQATVTTILDRLESRGLIERYRSLTDRRVVHARLTREGRRVLKKAPPLLQERFIAAFAALNPSEQDRIVRALEEVADMMGAGELDAAPLLAVGPPTAPDDASSAPKTSNPKADKETKSRRRAAATRRSGRGTGAAAE